MISYNSKFFTKNGKPWFPIMGEYEYSRTDRKEWKSGIAKMKALGLNAVQSYCIWLHHEEIKGHFNFRGNNNLRAFLRCVNDAGMKMCLRIGPWVHAELRNGGFPDWVYEQSYKPRTNDPNYLSDVEKYFREIYKQCKGYFQSEGGPIFSIQIENEFRRHTAGSLEEGEKHFALLIKMVRDIGFEVPILFATGWGNAVTGEAIPTWGEYAAQPWEQHADRLPPNSAYIIGSNPNEVPVGEYKERPAALGENKTARSNVPYMTIEQGSGNQPTRLRRPIVTGKDNGAMTFCRLAQGLVGLGYYVFHGGINPLGALSSTQEYREEKYMGNRDGYFCDLAERNYDFQGAVSMYNRISDTGRELKIWNTFASEFKDFLCAADVTLGDGNATDPADLISHRYSLRRLGDTGMLFYNNYVRLEDMPDKTLSGFTFEYEGGSITLPDTVIRGGEYAAFPFNLKYGDSLLRYATATPLCILNGKDLVLFSQSQEAEYSKEGDGRVIVISREDAQKAFKINLSGRQYLAICEGEIYSDGKHCYMEYTGSGELKLYPTPEGLCGFDEVCSDGDFAVFEPHDHSFASVGISVCEEVTADKYKEYTVEIAYSEELLWDVYLRFDFSADLAELYIDGEKVNDMLYTGMPFEVSMKYYDFPREITLRLYPLEKEREIYLERMPVYTEGVACSLEDVSIECVRKTLIETEEAE